MKLSLDNSALQLLSCKRRFQLTVIEGKVTESNDVLNYGNALHVMLEYLDKGHPVDVAYSTIKERYPKIDHAKILRATTAYLGQVKSPPAIELDSGPAIELKFSFHYGQVETPTGPVDITLEGTMDRIYLRDDWLIFRDYKSGVGATDYQMDKTYEEYDLQFQLPFYVYCMKNSGTLPAVYRDYIENHRYRTEIHFIFYNASPLPRIRKRDWPPYNSDFIDREVPSIIHARIREAVEVAQLTTPAEHTGMNVYKACGYCPFKIACLNMGTEKEIEYLSRFETKPYDPKSFR